MLYNISDFSGAIHPDSGLKHDDLLVLGRENIVDYILKNPDVFQDVLLEPWQGSTVMFGHNKYQENRKVDFSGSLINRIVISSKKTKKRRLALVISYDGSDFSGFQIQKSNRSVQAEIEKVVSRINGENTSVQGASRTDAGVHALGQVIHFDTARTFEPQRWIAVLNRHLPADVHCLKAAFVPPLFHSRYDAKKKTYRYVINTGEINPLGRKYEANYYNINLEVLAANLRQLIGTHDFTSFCSGKKEDKVRTIFEARYEVRGDHLELFFTGDGFLHHMVRLIVAELVKIATGQSAKDISEIIQEHSRKSTTKIAPAAGLYLMEVSY
jgi:tRNA pseudouridine38-40 synthase